MDTIKKGLFTFDLKVIGIVLMFVDHVHQIVIYINEYIVFTIICTKKTFDISFDCVTTSTRCTIVVINDWG